MTRKEDKVRNGVATVLLIYIIVGLAFLGFHTPEIGKWLAMGLAVLVLIAFTVLIFFIGYHWNESDY